MTATTPAEARTVARLARHVEVAVAACDMTVPQYRLLTLLAEGSANASALATRLVVSRPSVTALVDGLVARGMVERGTDPADRRRVTHVVTERGRAALAAAERAATARIAQLSRHLAPADVGVALAGLAAWGRALDSYREAKSREPSWSGPNGGSMQVDSPMPVDTGTPTRPAQAAPPPEGPVGDPTAEPAPPTAERAEIAEAGSAQAVQEQTVVEQATAAGMLLALWARVQPDAPAVLSECGERTFGELNARANRLASTLREHGVRAGDAVALLCSNRPEFVETLYAAQRSGLRLTPVNWHLTAEETAYVLRDCGAVAFVAEARFAATAAAAVEGLETRALLAVDGPIPGFEDYEQALEGGSPADIEDPRPGTTMLYTSGTTGRPKGVHRPAGPSPATVAVARMLGDLSGYVAGEDLNLVTGPLYHSAPLSFSLSLPISRGAGVVLMDRWDAEETLRLVERHRVTHTHMVPTMFHRLLSLPPEVRDRYDVSSLKLVWHGAAPCPVPVKQALMEWLGPIAWEYYAATEGVATVVSPLDWLARPGTVGKPDPGHVQVLDETGSEVPPGVPGTIFVHAPETGRFEYFGDAAKTAASYRGDYYTLGDVGYLDEEGWLFLTDRSVDLIISGGVNIYPAEVESALLTHPAVGDVGVIGVPDPEWGESVKAVVELQPGVEPSAALAEELTAWTRERIAGFKCPRSIDFVDRLPRSPAGKLVKRRLREEHRRQAAAPAAGARAGGPQRWR